MRRVSRAMGEELAGDCCDVVTVAPQKSSCGGHAQGVHHAAFGQFDFEFVFRLRLRMSQRRFGGLTERPFVCGFAGQSRDRKSTRLNSSHRCISYAVFCLKKKKKKYHISVVCMS